MEHENSPRSDGPIEPDTKAKETREQKYSQDPDNEGSNVSRRQP
jgi:hypothetical protein